MAIPPDVLRAALEEYMRLGPESRGPAADRLRARIPDITDDGAAAALVAVREAVRAAEQLAQECMNGHRAQATVARELRHRFPWLAESPARGDLDSRLAHFGFFLMK